MQTVIYYINKLKVSCEHSYSKYIFSMYLINIPTFQNSGSLFPHSKRQLFSSKLSTVPCTTQTSPISSRYSSRLSPNGSSPLAASTPKRCNLFF